MIGVPDVVRNRAVTVGATQWLEDLPNIVASLEDDWRIEVGEPFDEGTEAFVAAAVTDDGTPAVLKLLIPRSSGLEDREAVVLRLANGDGCPVLLRDDPARHALLLERLGPSMSKLELPYAERLPALCEAAQRIWRPAPDCGLPTGAEKAVWLIDYITTTWEALDRPCSEAVVEHALTSAQHRLDAHDDERSVLVHGDVHQWNALQFGDGFKLVDPDGLFAEAEYDLGVMLREDPEELLASSDPFESARWMAQRCGLDATAIWEWGVVERVSTGLMCAEIDLQPVGGLMLTAAEHVAGILPPR